jgi:MtN3 and saliva related transmembrane protein
MDINIEYIGMAAAIFTTAGFAPQVFKSLKTKEVGGVSLTMYVVMFMGLLFWLYYGIRINSFSMILANIVSGGLVLIQIVAKIVYSNTNE